MKILAGGIMQESHSFNPVTAERADFDILVGAVACESVRSTNSILGGIVDAAYEQGVALDIPCMFTAQSGGPVADAVFEEVAEQLCRAARTGGFDAVVLALHGGMLTPSLDDPEAELIDRLRAEVGPEVVIAAAFDLHAHVTERTIVSCDYLTGFRTNPHNDQAQTGARALRAAADIARGRFTPDCAMARLSLLTLGNDRTDRPGALADVHARVQEILQAGSVRDISIFNAQQFLDVEKLGQTILVYANRQPDIAAAVAQEIAELMWSRRDAFHAEYPSLTACLQLASVSSRPVVIGDQGDRVAAGGPGDSTYIFSSLQTTHPDLRTCIPIADADAVEACLNAGLGGEITLSVGGRYCTVAPPAILSGTVLNCARQVPLTMAGPYEAGRKTTLGPFAVVRHGNALVVLTSKPNAFIDPEYYRAAGIDLDAMNVIVTRSGYHFSLNYAPVGECLTADTPGLTSYRLQDLPFRKARPIYPVDQVECTPRSFSAGRTAGKKVR